VERPGYHKLMDFDKRGGKGETEEGKKSGRRAHSRRTGAHSGMTWHEACPNRERAHTLSWN